MQIDKGVPMSRAAEILEAFVETPNQRFVCSLASPYETNHRQTFAVEHCLRESPAGELLGDFRNCSAAAELIGFYSLHDGAVLFRDVESDAFGLELLKSATWPLLNEVIRETYSQGQAEDAPEWLEHFLAFGEAGLSGNYFILPTAGPAAGKVLYFDHERTDAEVWSSDFTTFIADITADPAEQFDRMGCFLRFMRHEGQWIPERFFSGNEIAW